MSKGFKKYILYSFLLLFYFHLIWITVYSQSIDELKDSKFDHITISQGLSFNETFSIKKDNQGFMWFATGEGLNRYDGINFKVYKHDDDDSNSLINNRIVDMAFDGTGFLWLATDGGLCRLDPRTETSRAMSTDPTPCLYIDKNELIWFGNKDGLNVINPETFKVSTYNLPEFKNNRFTKIFEDNEGILWLGTVRGLFEFDRTSGKFNKYFFTLRSKDYNTINYIWEDELGNLWLGNWGAGILKFNRHNGEYDSYLYDFSNKNAYTKNIVTSIYELNTANGNLFWIGTADKGLGLFDPEKKIFYFFTIDPANSWALNASFIYSIFNFDDRIWVGTNEGIFKYDKYSQKFKTWIPEPLKSSPATITKVLQDRLNKQIYWISTSRSGFEKYDKAKNTYVEYNNGNLHTTPTNDIINDMLQDSTGIIWLCTNDGLDRFNPQTEKLKVFRHNPADSESILSNIVYEIIQSKSGKYWISTPIGFSEMNSAGKFRNYSKISDENNETTDQNLFAIYEDNEKILWLGSQFGGLYRFDPQNGSFKIYNKKNGYTSTSTYSIIKDNSGLMWICSYSGLWKFDPANHVFKRYGTREGLPTEITYGINEDKKNNLWITTINGLSKFDPVTEKIVSYNINDGLTDNYISGPFDKCNDGNYYIGFPGKIDYFNPDEVPLNDRIPPVIITSFKIFNQEQKISDTIELSFGDKEFSFEFAVMNFSNPVKNQYAYMMEGFEKTWKTVNKGYATYTNMDPGEYIFKVKGSNNDGVWNDKGASVKIIIKPPFWRTLWFITSMGLIFVVILGSFYNYRVIQLKKSKQIQENFSRKLIENQENERKRIASELHDSLGQNLLVINNDVKQLLKKQIEPSIELEEISSMIFDSINEVRQISSDLHPHQLDRLGFKKAVEAMIKRVSSSTGIGIEYDIDNVDNYLNKNQQINIYRIIQECLNNIIKHSKANKVEILIKTDFKTVNLTIDDNGKGFNPNIISEGGFGLSGITERVRLLGGNLKIDSNEGKGTIIHLNMNFG